VATGFRLSEENKESKLALPILPILLLKTKMLMIQLMMDLWQRPVLLRVFLKMYRTICFPWGD
jgi:hypothetical protein